MWTQGQYSLGSVIDKTTVHRISHEHTVDDHRADDEHAEDGDQDQVKAQTLQEATDRHCVGISELLASK